MLAGRNPVRGVQHSNTREARDVLGSIQGRLSEGFDTRDLTEAKAVLAQLQR
jgi:hypothetical protein